MLLFAQQDEVKTMPIKSNPGPSVDFKVSKQRGSENQFNDQLCVTVCVSWIWIISQVSFIYKSVFTVDIVLKQLYKVQDQQIHKGLISERGGVGHTASSYANGVREKFYLLQTTSRFLFYRESSLGTDFISQAHVKSPPFRSACHLSDTRISGGEERRGIRGMQMQNTIP